MGSNKLCKSVHTALRQGQGYGPIIFLWCQSRPLYRSRFRVQCSADISVGQCGRRRVYLVVTSSLVSTQSLHTILIALKRIVVKFQLELQKAVILFTVRLGTI